jgi:hypothetical protein
MCVLVCICSCVCVFTTCTNTHTYSLWLKHSGMRRTNLEVPGFHPFRMFPAHPVFPEVRPCPAARFLRFSPGAATIDATPWWVSRARTRDNLHLNWKVVKCMVGHACVFMYIGMVDIRACVCTYTYELHTCTKWYVLPTWSVEVHFSGQHRAHNIFLYRPHNTHHTNNSPLQGPHVQVPHCGHLHLVGLHQCHD